MLAEHWDSQQRVKETMREAYEDRGRVFAGAYGEWPNPMSLTRAVKYLGSRVGHESMTVRSLRHFHASVTLQERTEHRRRQQAARACERVHYIRHLRALAAWVAEAGRRSIRGGDGR